MKKNLSLLLVMCCLISSLYCTPVSASAETAEEDEKIVVEATIDQDFSPDCVLVTLKKNYGKMNPKHSLDEFDGVEIESIEDLAEITTDDLSLVNQKDFRQILRITLKEKTKGNVLKAIKELKKLPGIRSAQPNYIMKADLEEYDGAVQFT